MAAPDPHRVRQGTAARTKATYLAAQYARLRVRRGSNRAATAVMHPILIAAWHMLQTGESYRDPSGDYYSAATPNASPNASSRSCSASATPSPSTMPKPRKPGSTDRVGRFRPGQMEE